MHTLSDTNPTYVTGSDRYRVSLAVTLTRDHPTFHEMEEFIPPARRNPDGYGLAFLESEEHSVAYVGSIRQIEDYCAANTGGTAALDTSQGACFEFWPHGPGWDEFLPATTWTPDGSGIVTQFDHPLGGKVVVYEYLADGADDEAEARRVGFHCEHCHNDPKFDYGAAIPNRGPQDRRWTARNARVHIRSHADQCRPADPRMAEAVTAVANDRFGVDNPVVTWESRCATTGPCAQIRILRARA